MRFELNTTSVIRDFRHKRNLADNTGGGGGAKLTVGIMNFILQNKHSQMPSSQLFNLKNMLKIFNIFFKLKSCENGI
jgi:hypothetical protein